MMPNIAQVIEHVHQASEFDEKTRHEPGFLGRYLAVSCGLF
jgi:hypothetical protein